MRKEKKSRRKRGSRRKKREKEGGTKEGVKVWQEGDSGEGAGSFPPLPLIDSTDSLWETSPFAITSMLLHRHHFCLAPVPNLTNSTDSLWERDLH